jgi:hypothetical protein
LVLVELVELLHVVILVVLEEILYFPQLLAMAVVVGLMNFQGHLFLQMA